MKKETFEDILKESEQLIEGKKYRCIKPTVGIVSKYTDEQRDTLIGFSISLIQEGQTVVLTYQDTYYNFIYFDDFVGIPYESLEERFEEVKEKYPVDVVFDGELEQDIRDRAKSLGLGVAAYIKSLVTKDLNQ